MEVPFIQEVSSVYTSTFLDTDDLKMALRARKRSGAFEKRAPGLQANHGTVRKSAIFPQPSNQNSLNEAILLMLINEALISR